MVYYRKYRPQTIAELDNPKLRDTLTAVLASKNLPHAFLFTGPKGLGKTSTARIIAKVLNCSAKDRKGIEPCNKCEQCVSITNGSSIDILEIDGASNRGIDEIRELRERVNLAPSSAKKKVYIIDEVHMLTTEAFNALLKTIEEPPEHVVFIFCTTEPQKIPLTIISRCFHVSLNRATEEELIHSLRRIADGEKIIVKDDVLQLIAQMADGSFRDGTKIFEELVLLSNKKEITKEVVENSYKTSNILLKVNDLIISLKGRNVSEALNTITDIINQGTDIRFFIYQLLSHLHSMLLNSVIGSVDTYPENARLDMQEIQDLAPLLDSAYGASKYSPLPQLPLELAVVKWCLGEENLEQNNNATINTNPVKQAVFEKERSFDSTQNDTSNSRSADKKVSKPSMTDLLKKEKNLKVQAIIRGSDNQSEPKKEENEEASHKQENLHENAGGNENLLENIIYKVKPYNHSVAGVLRGCHIKLINAERIVFETPYKFHKEKLDEVKTREILEKGVKEITGKNLSVMVELKQ